MSHVQILQKSILVQREIKAVIKTQKKKKKQKKHRNQIVGPVSPAAASRDQRRSNPTYRFSIKRKKIRRRESSSSSQQPTVRRRSHVAGSLRRPPPNDFDLHILVLISPHLLASETMRFAPESHLSVPIASPPSPQRCRGFGPLLAL
jgi:hypothetical protein